MHRHPIGLGLSPEVLHSNSPRNIQGPGHFYLLLFPKQQHSQKFAVTIAAAANAVAVPAIAADAVAVPANDVAGAADAVAPAAADAPVKMLALDFNRPCLRSRGRNQD